MSRTVTGALKVLDPEPVDAGRQGQIAQRQLGDMDVDDRLHPECEAQHTKVQGHAAPGDPVVVDVDRSRSRPRSGICRLGTWMPVTSAAGGPQRAGGGELGQRDLPRIGRRHADLVHGEQVEPQSGDPKAGRRQLDVVDLDTAETRPAQVQIGQGRRLRLNAGDGRLRDGQVDVLQGRHQHIADPQAEADRAQILGAVVTPQLEIVPPVDRQLQLQDEPHVFQIGIAGVDTGRQALEHQAVDRGFAQFDRTHAQRAGAPGTDQDLLDVDRAHRLRHEVASRAGDDRLQAEAGGIGCWRCRLGHAGDPHLSWPTCWMRRTYPVITRAQHDDRVNPSRQPLLDCKLMQSANRITVYMAGAFVHAVSHSTCAGRPLHDPHTGHGS